MTKGDQNMDLDYFKSRLEKERSSLVAELKKVGRRDPKNPNDWDAKSEDMDILLADRNEVDDKFESLEGDVAIDKELEPHLNDVKAALEKIENHTYGTCEICGKTIEIERLKANPAAKTCMKDINEKVV